ncbi:MAG: hypothetical protein HC854_08015 [Flavobacterium sp.]|nr:hypothetical protein [Flavobacterium sp.]
MTKFILFTVLLFFSFQIHAQEKELGPPSTKTLGVEKETRTIYIIGGIAATITKEDLAFAKKYNIQYHDFGCLAPINFQEYETINTKLFEKLNAEFGENWQKEIKSSAMGFEKWRKR